VNEVNQTTSGSVRTVSGVVVSAKMDKTVTVVIERKVAHPLYRKYVKRFTKLYVHDEKNECSVNDKVLVQECRPISKKKSWRLLEVLESGSA